jgi:hypothetical protein
MMVCLSENVYADCRRVAFDCRNVLYLGVWDGVTLEEPSCWSYQCPVNLAGEEENVTISK